MHRMRYRLRTLLILLAAAPLWIYVITIVTTENRAGFEPKALIVAPILLAGITAALYRLTRRMPDGLAIAALLSPIIPLAVLLAVRISNA
jgi:peptidoglycan/LPS O-acetylase OafA/YrhL